MAGQTTAIYLQMTRLAWRNVLRNWRHSLATILAIASGFIAVSLFDGFIMQLEYRNKDGYQTRGMLGHVLVQRKDAQFKSMEDQWLYAMDKDEQSFLDDYFKHDPDFLSRVRFLNISGMVNAGPYNTVFVGFGLDLKEGAEMRGKRWYWDTAAGVPLVQYPKSSVTIGLALGKLIECESTYQGPPYILEYGNYTAENRPFVCKYPRITLSATTAAAQVNALDVPVSGLFDAGFREADKRAVRLSLADAQRLMDTDKITMISIELKDERLRKGFIKRLKAAAEAAHQNFDVMPWQEHTLAAYLQGGIDVLHVFRNLFMTIVVTIGVMSVANTMMKSVNERIREIGTLRSLGFLREHLVYMFSMEGLFLSILACAIGLVGTVILTTVIGNLGLTYRAGVLSAPIGLSVGWSWGAWILCTIVLMALATSTAWFCSRRASRMVIADAMRHV